MRKLCIITLTSLFMIMGFFTNLYAIDDNISFTEEELLFIEEHPVIKLGVDPSFLPFEFIDTDGEYKGITADYLKLISEKTGLIFEVEKNLTWPEAYDLALNQEVDMLPAISKTTDREQYFLFSDPYYYFKRVIVTRDNETGITGIEDLYGMTVAVQRNSSHHSYLITYPKINLSLYDSVEAALTAVANGTEEAFVGNLATTSYFIKANALTNLKFVAFEAEKELGLSFAVRTDWPELISILNKALGTITEEEKIAINNKWINLDTEPDYSNIIQTIIVISCIFLIIFIVSLYWILRLKEEVKKRKMIQVDLEKAKQEAIEANNFKSSFMARMSHEIRTPLNAITGMAYLLKKTNITQTQGLYIERIKQASTSMLNIINDILDYSKIEAGKIDIEAISFSMDRVIHDVINIISYKIEENKIGFKFTRDSLLPNWFIGDPKRIEQILINILNNAIKFTDNGEVSLDIALLSITKDDCNLAFTIKDTGIGMTKGQVDKLFEPFTQADSSITRRFGGTGLGLSIVKNLLDLMNGKIQVISDTDQGSSFIINICLKVDQDKENEYRKNISNYNFKSIKILVLEKSISSINQIENYLNAFGMNCELATSQGNVVSLLENASDTKAYDLLIIDYETPDNDGFQFIKDLRNNKKINLPKIMMLLPMLREDLFDKLDKNNIDIGIGKPIIPSILLNGILDIFKQPTSDTTYVEAINDGKKQIIKKNHTVLIAEDNKTNQLIAQSLLKQENIDAILADNGKIAVDIYNQNKDKIDLILMDLHMPIMNGYEAAKEIRNISKDVPIIALTADVILGIKEKCEENGIYYYISKPFDPDSFLLTIKTILNDESEIDNINNEIIDQAIGLRNLGNDRDLYYQVLKQYLNENMNITDDLEKAISEQDYIETDNIIHKLKSSSGSIGATSIYEAAIEFQKALKRGNKIEIIQLQTKFINDLKELLKQIQILVSSQN